MVKWFTDKYPVNLGLLYFEEPDSYGHEFGPDSPQMNEMIIGSVTFLVQSCYNGIMVWESFSDESIFNPPFGIYPIIHYSMKIWCMIFCF
jgi:hypothetical protein